MAARPRIAVDAMGGDGGPAVTVPAALALVAQADILLVGDAERIRRALPPGESPPPLTTGAPATYEVLPPIAIHHASQALRAADSLADVLRRRPDSSLRQALLQHAEGRVDAVVSAGDTAALMALARATLAMVEGVERPAICKDLEGVDGPFWMLDLGANIDCSVVQLQQFARMGVILARHVGGVADPRAALLNIGTEPGKGPDLLGEAARCLEQDPRVRFVGFIEGSDLFSGRADVVVADGFAGNVALKSIEGAARMAGHLLAGWRSRLGPLERAAMLLAAGKLRELRELLNPQRYNGACFVGLRGVVVKSHGSADAEGFGSAIEEAVREVQGRVPLRLAEVLTAG